jgi:CO/xanthine dehydrogenase FAD-binding subunit
MSPSSLDEALDALAAHPNAHILAGGTDFMVEVNYGHRRPDTIISLRRVRELRQRDYQSDRVVLGAGVTYADLGAADVARHFPALGAAARTVGSPQIRNAGTLGGNVGTGSPAGDTLPVLAALDAQIHLLATDRSLRIVPWSEFFIAPKRTARRSNELIVGVELALHDTRQDYLKVGTRNAMVISVAGLALVVDRTDRTVRVGLGSVGPVPLRAPEAEAFASEHIAWDRLAALPDFSDTSIGDASGEYSRAIDDPRTYETFGVMVAGAAKPISDQRSTADYRAHAVKVLAQRALMRLV